MDRIDGHKGMVDISKHTPKDYYIKDSRDSMPVTLGNPDEPDTWELVPYDSHSSKF